MLSQAVLGRLRDLDRAGDVDDRLVLGDHFLGRFVRADNLYGECLVGFMVESPAQSGRKRTLIHLGAISRVHVNTTSKIVQTTSKR